jgi:type IV pilus assembly protein PilV
MLMNSRRSRTRQSGSALIEALISILVFSIGVLSLMALQAVSIKNSADAKYRSDASYLAKQIVAQMWVDRSNIDNYAHYPTGTSCAFSGSASSVAQVTTWNTQVAAALPGASAAKPQIQVSTVSGTKQVKVTVCWKGPQETVTHNFAMTARINP